MIASIRRLSFGLNPCILPISTGWSQILAVAPPFSTPTLPTVSLHLALNAGARPLDLLDLAQAAGLRLRAVRREDGLEEPILPTALSVGARTLSGPPEP